MLLYKEADRTLSQSELLSMQRHPVYSSYQFIFNFSIFSSPFMSRLHCMKVWPIFDVTLLHHEVFLWISFNTILNQQCQSWKCSGMLTKLMFLLSISAFLFVLHHNFHFKLLYCKTTSSDISPHPTIYKIWATFHPACSFMEYAFCHVSNITFS